MKDFRGLDLHVGDRIAYATTSSSNVEMHEGIVVGIIKPKPEGRHRDKGKLKVETNTSWECSINRSDNIKVVTLTRRNRVAKLEDTRNPLSKTVVF